MRSDDCGAYMVAEYLDYESLLQVAARANSNLIALSECGQFVVDGEFDNHHVLMKGPSEERVLLDNRD